MEGGVGYGQTGTAVVDQQLVDSFLSILLKVLKVLRFCMTSIMFTQSDEAVMGQTNGACGYSSRTLYSLI